MTIDANFSKTVFNVNTENPIITISPEVDPVTTSSEVLISQTLNPVILAKENTVFNTKPEQENVIVSPEVDPVTASSEVLISQILGPIATPAAQAIPTTAAAAVVEQGIKQQWIG